jgi:hypothetical protein
MKLTYFSPVPWDSYEQRPHYFVRDFLNAGGESVAWINPYPARLPNWRDLTRQDLRDPPLILAKPPALRVLNPGGLPIDPLPGGPAVNEMFFWRRLLGDLRREESGGSTIVGIGRPTGLAITALRTLAAAWSFYDAMDDFPEFYSGQSRAATARVEAEIAGSVSRIFVSSARLAEKFAGVGPPVTFLPNAFDMSLLQPVRANDAKPVRVGFVGCIGSWFDWEATVRLATAINPVPVTLVGPIASSPPASLPSNIDLQPPCPQPDAVKWLESFSVGLIPCLRNPLTASMDSIKYYQYRGAGLPVLSTRFGEMAARGDSDDTYFIDDPAGPLAAFERSQTRRLSMDDVLRFRIANDWAERFRTTRIWQTR